MKRKMKPKKFLTPDEEKQILTAIQEAEQKTSGEICIHLAKHCWGSVYEEAVKIFEKLGMTRTAERNGILIYLALKNYQFAIVGDIGIHQKVSPDFWQKVRDVMQDDFKKGEFTQGLLDGIQMCGDQLERYFPCKTEDQNELPDQISSE